jgi:mono/diheme cytochrome c family protein
VTSPSPEVLHGRRGRCGRPSIPFVAIVGILLVLAACTGDRGASTTANVAGAEIGDSDRGRELFVGYGCGACHQLGGVRTAVGRVGPRLDDLAEQRIIGGVLPNTPEQLAAWIREPRAYSADSGMPNVGVTEQHSYDIASFLLEPR